MLDYVWFETWYRMVHLSITACLESEMLADNSVLSHENLTCLVPVGSESLASLLFC